MAQEHIENPIEVWLLTGYLGAGKTTALNHLLSCPPFAKREIAMVINEFGKMGIDGQLVRPGAYAKFEINKGSIFCICTKTDLLRTFEKIRALKPEAVLIEATGVTETSDLEQLLSEPLLKADFEIRGNLCIVDAVSFIKTAAFLKAAVSQVQCADGLVINKTDQVSENQIEQVAGILKELNPSAAMTRTQFGKIDTHFVQGLRHNVCRRPLLTCPPMEIPAVHIAMNHSVSKDLFYKTVYLLENHILRLKGDVCFEDGPRFVEIVGEQVIEKPACGRFETRTAFTVIGWKIEKQQLKDAFRKCFIREVVKTSN